MLARQNLHLDDRIPLRNVTEDSKARDELMKVAGREQAPCLVVGGKPMHESKEVIRHLVTCATDIQG